MTKEKKEGKTGKESKNKKLSEKLFLKKESGWNSLKDPDKKALFAYCDGYMDFLAKCKTEREVLVYAESLLKKSGFKAIESVSSLKPGDKIYMISKNKNVAVARIGKDVSKDELTLNIVGAHIDSPRLDLKPYPMFEDSNLALLKSHYYGGIKKYQWVSRNLAIHGVISTKDGKSVEIRIGDNEGDPVFMIPDLLPHLAKEQMKRDASKIVTGEELNLIVGHIPVDDKDISEKVKFEVLRYLNEKYGITEHDLITSEIEIVPSEMPRDVGFDRSMISAYGQDDRVCAYAGLKAIIEADAKSNTSVLMLFDKEEIGSEGNTGAKSRFTELFVEKILKLSKDKSTLNEVFHRSRVLSSDVTAGADPTFKDVNDPANCSYLGHGVSVEKYGGGGGKYSTNDASSEYMRYVVDLFDSNNVKWQTGELGRIDLGGGGTIAMYLAEKGCDVIDVGPCVLGMHSPAELTSKFDVYQSFLGYKAFLSR